jgi:hypothetical protein
VGNESEHMRDALESLPAEQRVRRYREMANAAFREAQYIKPPQQRMQCLRLAWSWHAMAQQAEAEINGRAQLQAGQERPCDAGTIDEP